MYNLWRNGNTRQRFFDQFGIQTLVGIGGSIDEVIEKFRNGTLKGTESFCKPGTGKGYGIDKSACDHSGQDKCAH